MSKKAIIMAIDNLNSRQDQFYYYYNKDKFIEDIVKPNIEEGDDEEELIPKTREELATILRFAIRDKFKVRFQNGTHIEPHVNLSEGYVSHWREGDEEYYIYSIYNSRKEEFQYNYKEVDKREVDKLRENFAFNDNFLEAAGYRSGEVLEMPVDLLLTDIQGYNYGFLDMDNPEAKIADEILAHVFEEE